MANLSGYGVPRQTTVGELGDIYQDLNTGKFYELVFISRTSKQPYKWKLCRTVAGKHVSEDVGGAGNIGSWDRLSNRPFYKMPNPTPVLFDDTVICEEATANNGRKYYTITLTDIVFDIDNTIPYKITINDAEYIEYPSIDSNKEILQLSKLDSSFKTIFTISFTLVDGKTKIKIFSTDTSENYIKIEDTREYIYKYLSDEFLPQSLGRAGSGENSWILGVQKDDTVNIVDGYAAFVSGLGNKVSKSYAFVLGTNNEALYGNHGLVSGIENKASAYFNYVYGQSLIASSQHQYITGRYNIEDASGDKYNDGKYIHIIGNGTSDKDRSNAHTVDWDGNAWYAGNIEGKAMIINSSTEGSTKRFKITVNDDGVISAEEVTT